MAGQDILNQITRMLAFLCFFLWILTSTVAAGDDESVDLAYYRPDRSDLESKWIEGWSYKDQFSPDYFGLSGSFHVYLKNLGSSELKIANILLNGKPLPELRDELKVVWWKVLPNPVPPKSFFEVIIRLRYPPEEAINEILLHTDKDEVIRCEVAMEMPKLNIAYVGFSREIDTLYVYVEGEEGQKLSRIYLDGDDVTTKARIYPQFHNLSFVELNLDEPLEYGSYHVIKVINSNGAATANTIRAWDNWFDITFWGGSQPPHPFLREHFFESGLCVSMRAWERSNEEIIKRAGDWKDQEFSMYELWSEPDVGDYNLGKAQPPVDRIGFMAQRLVEASDFIRKVDPGHMNYILLNNTCVPVNWKIYGEVADIMGTDPYAIQDAINKRTLYYVAYAAQEAYAACSPRPLNITLGAFQLRRGGFQRLPTPEEERIMLYYALGGGAKGINYFIWGSDSNVAGVTESPALQEEIGRLNAELQVCSPLLSIAHPIPGNSVRSSTEDLYTRTLLAGKSNMVIVLANNSYRYKDWRSKEGEYTLNPLEDMTIEVEIPPYLRVNDVRRIDHDGIKTLSWKRKSEGRLEVSAGDVKAAGMIVLTEDPAPLIQRYEQFVVKLRKEQKERIERIERARHKAREILMTESQDLKVIGLVGAYYFVAGKGITLVDATQNRNDGAILSSGELDKYITTGSEPVWTEGKVSGALSFDGEADYVLIESSPSLRMREAITIEVIFKAEEKGTLVSRGIDFLELLAEAGGVGFLIITEPEGKTQYRILRTPLETGKWYHVTATYDKSKKEKKLYVNGLKRSQEEQSGLLKRYTNPFIIGQRGYNYKNHFKGEIALVKIYDRALTEEEVRRNSKLYPKLKD